MTRRARWAAGAAIVMIGIAVFPTRAPATIAEQRARLPPAAECGDEIVAGVWRSHKYDTRYGEWAIFTLTIRRVQGDPDSIVGTIQNHSWDGTSEQAEPPPCERQPGREMYVSMDARGRVTDGTHIQFDAYGSWRTDSIPCGRGWSGYNLDHFSGVIDPAILEFQSVNNDGGRSVNDPTVFRRVRCPPVNQVESPSVKPRPPAFYPNTGGCSLF